MQLGTAGWDFERIAPWGGFRLEATGYAHGPAAWDSKDQAASAKDKTPRASTISARVESAWRGMSSLAANWIRSAEDCAKSALRSERSADHSIRCFRHVSQVGITEKQTVFAAQSFSSAVIGRERLRRTAGRSKRRVMVISESDRERSRIIEALNPSDYEFIEARSGREASRTCRLSRIDLVIVDMQVARIGGAQLLRLLDLPVTMKVLLVADDASSGPFALHHHDTVVIAKQALLDQLEVAIHKLFATENEERHLPLEFDSSVQPCG
jgi:CheY-like chemotaxis protein